ncbi:MAG: hypothetical protein HY075_04980 [Deltaproteobacteria bacterium]|nr:hypothetical protein [Deltaproteobacteria bacterium]
MGTKFGVLFLATFLLGATAAVAETSAALECGDVKVAAMAQIPVPNQGALNTCYAYAGAQLIDAWRFTNPKDGGDENFEHLTSALEAAFDARAPKGDAASSSGDDGMSFDTTDDSIDFGRPCEAVNAIRERGSCDDRVIGDAFKGTKARHSIAQLRAIYDNFHMIKGDPAMRQALLEEMDTILRKQLALPDALVPAQAELVELLERGEAIPFLRGVVSAGCTAEHRLKEKFPACDEYRPKGGAEPEKLYAARLARHRPPPRPRRPRPGALPVPRPQQLGRRLQEVF